MQVKLGVLKTNKPLTLYEHPEGSYVTCMAARRDGNAVLSGHADGSLHIFRFDYGRQAGGSTKFSQQSCPPAAATWGSEAVLVTGSDCKVSSFQAKETTKTGFCQMSNYQKFCSLAGCSPCIV